MSSCSMPHKWFEPLALRLIYIGDSAVRAWILLP
ncbi:hypothetical protein ABIA99_003738 [Bradyrhizobium sp. LB12.1]